MDTQQERLLQLDRDLKSGKNICSSGGVLSCFPSSLKEPFLMQGLGLIVCRQGSFQFSLDNKCASAKLISAGQETGGRKNEIFVRLIQLIEQYYMQERSVEFYADKLCLSPKYLSALSKSICGYTVQELVFKAIIRKCISLLKNTQKNIQEISNEFGFPNASYFGTFFKKQMGMSPQQYRRNL